MLLCPDTRPDYEARVFNILPAFNFVRKFADECGQPGQHIPRTACCIGCTGNDNQSNVNGWVWGWTAFLTFTCVSHCTECV